MYGLVIERPFEQQGEVPFMCEDPLDIILSGNFSKVPLIMGYTDLEGSVVDSYRPERSLDMVDDPESNLSRFLGYKRGTQESRIVAQKVQEFYFGNNKRDQSVQDQIYSVKIALVRVFARLLIFCFL